MSIKIYDGVRVKLADIGKFTKLFDKRCLTHIEKQTRHLMAAVKHEKLLTLAEKAVGLRGDMPAEKLLKNVKAENYFRFKQVAKLYVLSMQKGHNFLNPECWFNAFPYRDHFYIIPGYPTAFKLNKYPAYVEDFSYWNNTDPPEGISYSDFRKRQKIWGKDWSTEHSYQQQTVSSSY